MNGKATNSKRREAVDVGAQSVADAYAKAFVEAGLKAGAADKLLDELNSWIDVLDKTPKLDRVLATAMVEPEEKLKLLDKALRGKATPLVLNLLKVLAKRERLEIVRTVAQTAGKLLDKFQNRKRVVIATANPLEARHAAELESRIQAALGGELIVRYEVDPAHIGGIVVRVGDHVVDASIATNLVRLKEQLINRSVHEIQRRRDSFSSPAGN